MAAKDLPGATKWKVERVGVVPTLPKIYGKGRFHVGELHGKNYILDTSELREWIRVLEEPTDCYIPVPATPVVGPAGEFGACDDLKLERNQQALHFNGEFVHTKSSPLTSPIEVGTVVSFGVNEAAHILKCSTKTVHNLCRKDLLPFHWVGNKRRFTAADINEFRSTSRRKIGESAMPLSTSTDLGSKGGGKRKRRDQGSDAERVTLREVRDLCQR